jgi:ABC-2 type transport system ATP-binding protein
MWKFKFLKRGRPVETEGVKFSYSQKEVLREISIHLKEKEIVAIVGKSGSGKSTFLKILSGIIALGYSGKIRIFGRPKFFQKDKTGFVPQEVSIIPDLSIEDNIRVSGLNLGISEKNALKKADELMKLLKLEEPWTKKSTELSGGQKARLNIILSLLHDPQILILDEPFVGLDFENRRLVWHFLESMKNKGKSVILTSHLLSEAQEHADRIVILKDGRIFFSGNLENLKKKLKIQFIMEIRISRISQENYDKLKKHCYNKDIKIMDAYEKYLMFGLNSEKAKDTLVRILNGLGIKFEEKSFREPNLDEVFLKAG